MTHSFRRGYPICPVPLYLSISSGMGGAWLAMLSTYSSATRGIVLPCGSSHQVRSSSTTRMLDSSMYFPNWASQFQLR